MPNIRICIPAFLMILMLPVLASGEQSLIFQHIGSVYTDDKDQGLLQPQGVACAGKSLVIADTGNNRLLLYKVHDETLEWEGPIQAAQLPYPIKVQINSKGDIYGLSGQSRKIAHLTRDGKFLGLLEIKGLPDEATVITRSFKIDRNDNFYVLDIFSGRVIVLDPQGNYLHQVDFSKESGVFSDLAVDNGGTVFLLDSAKSMVYMAAGNAKTFVPLSTNLKENLQFPTQITVTGQGLLYVVDQNGGSIALIGRDGSFRGRKLGMGWNEGLLNYPTDMCINEAGQAFIADRNNNRVQFFR